jgi:hypothetical protein
MCRFESVDGIYDARAATNQATDMLQMLSQKLTQLLLTVRRGFPDIMTGVVMLEAFINLSNLLWG